MFYQKLPIIIFIIAVCLFVVMFLKWKKLVDKRNIQLMQLYLELKFLYKNLNSSVVSDSGEHFCRDLIQSIKEYYNLVELIIIDTIHLPFHTDTFNGLKQSVYNFLKDNIKEVSETLKFKKFSSITITIEKKEYVLYIFPLAPNTSDSGFIICLENSPTLLSQNELLGLENNINLLKTRLLL